MQQDTQTSVTRTNAHRALLVILLILPAAAILLCTRFELGLLGNVFMLFAGGAAGYAAFAFGHSYLALLTAIPALLSLLLPGSDLTMLCTAILTPLAAFLLALLYGRHVSRIVTSAALTALFLIVHAAQFFASLYVNFGTVTQQIFLDLYREVQETITHYFSVFNAANTINTFGIDASMIDQMMQTMLYLMPGVLILVCAVSGILSDLCFRLFCRLCGGEQDVAPSSRSYEVSIVSAILYLVLSLLSLFLSVGGTIGTAALNLYLILTPFLFTCGCRTYFRSPDGKHLNIPGLLLSVFLLFFNPLWLIVLIALNGAVTAIAAALRVRYINNPRQ